MIFTVPNVRPEKKSLHGEKKQRKTYSRDVHKTEHLEHFMVSMGEKCEALSTQTLHKIT